jgi:hypothetical protein
MHHPLAANAHRVRPGTKLPADGIRTMLKWISKFVLEVLPSALATLIGGILLSSYHYHFMTPRAPATPKAIVGEVAPPAAGGNVVEGAHAAVVEQQQPGSSAEPAKAHETKAPEVKPPETTAHETKGAEAKPPESKRHGTKAARVSDRPARPIIVTPGTADAATAHRIDQPAARIPSATALPPPPPASAAAPRPSGPAVLAQPVPAAPPGPVAPPPPVAAPGSVAAPAPVVPEPFSVTELNAKLAGAARPQVSPAPPPAAALPPVRFGGPLDPLPAPPRPAVPDDFAR